MDTNKILAVLLTILLLPAFSGNPVYATELSAEPFADDLNQFYENQDAVASAGGGEFVTLASLSGFADTSVSRAEPPANATLVIDISEWQVRDPYEPQKDELIDFDVIDYDLISQQVDGIILRVGYTGWGTGESLNADIAFERFYREFALRGVPMGAYWYSCADTVAEGVREAQMALRLINGRRFDLPVYWDTEDNYHQAKVSAPQLTDTGIAFMDTIRAAGYRTGLYAGTHWLNNRLEMPRLAGYNLWVAQWQVSWPTYNGSHFGMWQYASTGRLAGYDRDLDVNYLLPRTFTDVPSNEWFYVPVENLAHHGIIQGYLQTDGTRHYVHKDYLTRAQAAKMIVLAAGLPYQNKTASFADVPATHWATGYIAAAEEAGIIRGYGDGLFRPNDRVSRAQIAQMVCKAFDLQSGSDTVFIDVNSEHWARPYIDTLSGMGIIVGYKDRTFRPSAPATRAQFAKMLSLSMDGS